MFRTRCTVLDWIVVIAVLCVFVGLLILPLTADREGSLLIVTTPSERMEYSLNTDKTLTVSSGGYTVKIEIRDGRARVAESNCPDGICKSSGWISKSGEMAICAPAGVRISVKGGDGDVDFIAG